MPFERPTVEEILARMQSDFRTVLPDFDPFLPRSVLLAMIHSTTAAVHELNGRLERLARNHFADTAELEELDRIGAIHGVARNFGTKATGILTAVGVHLAAIPAGTFLVTSTGVRVVSTSSDFISGTICNFAVEAVEIGTSSNLPVDTVVELEEPITGINPGQTLVSTEITGGADDELVEDYRARVLLQIRKRPQGGTLTDFERWARESDSKWTRVFFVKPATGSNLIQGYAVDDSLDADGNAITPTWTLYASSEIYLKDDSRRPLCANVQFDAPTLTQISPSITLVPNTAAVQAEVKAEIIDFLKRESSPGWTLYKSALDEAISRAVGETDHTTTVPAGNLVAAADAIHTIGTVTFS